MKNLTKAFRGTEKPALDNLSLSLESGKIIGLVGPDGAGKTTLIRSILGLLLPSCGEVKTLGVNPCEQKDFINQNIGYMPQKFGLYEDLTVMENLDLYADLKGLSQDHKDKSFKTLLNFTGLGEFISRLAGDLSGGMKQKLGLACSLLGRPGFLVLDEPSVGVDPISRRELLRMVQDLCDEGMTILWSTAYLDEAEKFSSCVLLNEGKLLYQGAPQDLTSKLEGRTFFAYAKDGKNRALLKQIIKDGDGLTDAVIQADSVRVVLDRGIQKYENLDLQPTTPRFEDAVIDILGGCPKGESSLSHNLQIVDDASEYVIEADALVKRYGSFYAVKNNTFKVKKGEIFGLLGPNGAGKSTSFKMLCGLVTPTSGTARIMGLDIQKNLSKARSYLGYMAQKFSLFGGLSVMQNLKFFSGIYGLNIWEQRDKINQMVDIFDLKPYLGHNADELPLGFKQRLALSCALMHNPPILFLDEPTSGVDPLTRRDFWNHINTLVEKGVTVMVTTHFMDEAEYCDRISLFYRGEAIETGTPSELKNKVSKDCTMEEAFIALIEKYDRQKIQRMPA
ncbi:MAG: ATP-binding cassette domain-containing protein [Candidatus Gastranaerophilales bacterium]|nr:ATP-binding cassette domain-containing protein [Candidatus Gastranaerophilales bacterium]